jgi:hypothetical protein
MVEVSQLEKAWVRCGGRGIHWEGSGGGAFGGRGAACWAKSRMGMPVMEYVMVRNRGRRKERRAREDGARKPKPPFRTGSVASDQLSSGRVGVRVRSERNWRAIFSIPKMKGE